MIRRHSEEIDEFKRELTVNKNELENSGETIRKL